jgi:hypothetical protein
MKTMVIEGKSVDVKPLDRIDFNRVQRRHENNMLGRDPERSPLIPNYPFLPWRFTLHANGYWTHLLPENNSSFSQDRFGWGTTGHFSRDFLLRKPPSPASLPWMPRLRLGAYARLFRPKWKLSVDAEYQPLAREFGGFAGLAWDGFFMTGNAGYVDYSNPFNSKKPYAYGLNIGFESLIKKGDFYKMFWDFGLYYQRLYVDPDSAELFSKVISHYSFWSISYGFLTGPSIAF